MQPSNSRITPDEPKSRVTIAYLLAIFPALTETFVLREMASMQRRGVDLVVCAVRRPTTAEDPKRGELPLDGVPAFYARPDGVARHVVANLTSLLRHPHRYVTALGMFLRAGWQLPPGEALQLVYHFFAGVGFTRELRRLGVTWAHSHFTSATNMALAGHLVEGFPFSFTAHASDDLFVRPVLLDEKVARARFVVAVCDYSQRYLDSVTGFRYSTKLRRIYNGVELLPNRTETGQAASVQIRPRIVSVGSLIPAKGHATLIQVCAALRAQGHDFSCRIVGEGPARPLLERLIQQHELAGTTELTGALPLDQVYEELRAADVFVFLGEIGPRGQRDGFPTAILEAMAAGLPVLATSLSGIPEMVVDGVTGILVRERDAESATQALAGLLQSAELRLQMGLAGRARVRERFDVERSADHLAALLLRQDRDASRGP
jgi:glycosyltransferase involved in cell wall biosynthesis